MLYECESHAQKFKQKWIIKTKQEYLKMIKKRNYITIAKNSSMLEEAHADLNTGGVVFGRHGLYDDLMSGVRGTKLNLFPA